MTLCRTKELCLRPNKVHPLSFSAKIVMICSGGEKFVYGVPLAFSVNFYLRVGGVTLRHWKHNLTCLHF